MPGGLRYPAFSDWEVARMAHAQNELLEAPLSTPQAVAYDWMPTVDRLEEVGLIDLYRFKAVFVYKQSDDDIMHDLRL